MNTRHWLTLAAVIVTELVSATGSVAVFAGLHAWQKMFGNTPGIGWILSSYLLVSAVGAAVFGRLGDMYGRRRMLLFVCVLFLAGSLVSMVSTSLEGIVIGRVLQGSAGAILSLLMGVVRDRLPAERTPFFVSTIIAAASVGSAFTLVLAGMLTDAYGPGAIFGFQVALAVAALGMIWLFIPADSDLPAPARFDWMGGALFTLGVTSVLFAITEIGGTRLHWGAVAACLVVSVMILVYWYRYEKRQADPLIDVTFLANPTALTTNLVLFAISMGAMQNMQVFAPLLQQAPDTGIGFALSATEMSLVKFPALAMGLFGSAIAAWIIVRNGTRRAIALGCTLILAGCVMPIALSGSLWMTIVAVGVMNLGMTAAYSAIPTTIMAVCPAERTSEATGLMSVFRATGQAVGAQAIGVLLASSSVLAGSGHYFPSPLAYMLALGAMAVLSLVALIGTSRLKRGIGAVRARSGSDAAPAALEAASGRSA